MMFMTRAGPRPGQRRWPRRLGWSAAWAALVAAGVMLAEATAGHAEMAAGAAQAREPLAVYLAAAWMGLWVLLAGVAFALASAVTALRRIW